MTLANNSGTGLDVEVASASVAITSSNFTNKPAGNGVTNNGSGSTVDARSSWWGSATGPTIASNPGGTGDAITGSNAAGVQYSPFATTPN